jgi:hypothetical protein
VTGNMVHKSPSKILLDVKRMTKFIRKKNMRRNEMPNLSFQQNPQTESKETQSNLTKNQFFQILNKIKAKQAQEQDHSKLKQKREQDLAKFQQDLDNIFKEQYQHHQWPK